MYALLWTFPVLMFASIIVGWAAEITAVRLSAGIALAVLAWLQCAPEFAVEATIAWSRDSHLALANLTGSLRLLIGLGWPVVFAINYYSRKRRKLIQERGVVLPEAFAIEAVGLAIPVFYFLGIIAKGTWTTIDGVILCSFYALYFFMLNRQRRVFAAVEFDEHGEGEPWVVEKILEFKPKNQMLSALAIFVFGGALLLITVHPFVDALKATALHFGISEFIFIQWIAPIASEFPEKVTAFGWARKPSKVPMAIINMLSSVTSQWTLLAGLVPIVFTLSAGHFVTIELEPFQKTELLLTVVQSALVVLFLADLRIKNYEAIGLFVLWLAQFLLPHTREPLIVVYAAWMLVESIRLIMNPKECRAWSALVKVARG